MGPRRTATVAPTIVTASVCQPANPRYRLRMSGFRTTSTAVLLRIRQRGACGRCATPLASNRCSRPRDFRMYHRANARFAAAVADEADGAAPLVLVQDYHFALAPTDAAPAALPASTIVAFWHIPWPRPGASPVVRGRRLLDGLLASDIVGLQTPDDCRHFLERSSAHLDATVDRDEGEVTWCGHTTRVRAYPVGVEWSNPACLRGTAAVQSAATGVLTDLGLPEGVRLGVGVDRLDYTKGINEKFLAVERLLERDAACADGLSSSRWPSRAAIACPRTAPPAREIVATSERINARFGSAAYRPIVLLESASRAGRGLSARIAPPTSATSAACTTA